MQNNIQIFENKEFGKLEVLMFEGQPFFPATECAIVLGYKKPHDAVSRHCRYSVKHGVPHPQSPDKVIEVNYIPESDLYRLIIRSKLPAAVRFEAWVCDEVLPSIRKHGAYLTAETLSKAIQDPSFLINVLSALQSEQEKNASLNKTIGAQELQIAEMKPKANYYDVVLQCKDAIPITVIAKDYGKSAMWLNAFLHELKVQYKFKTFKCWLLYKEYADKGFTTTTTSVTTNETGSNRAWVFTSWTQKGRLFLYELLKAHGYLPLIEGGSNAKQQKLAPTRKTLKKIAKRFLLDDPLDLDCCSAEELLVAYRGACQMSHAPFVQGLEDMRAEFLAQKQFTEELVETLQPPAKIKHAGQKGKFLGMYWAVYFTYMSDPELDGEESVIAAIAEKHKKYDRSSYQRLRSEAIIAIDALLAQRRGFEVA